MAFYLKKFGTHSEYEQYINGSGVILPNVSLTVDNYTVHYNPSSPVPPTPTDTRLVCKYNVTSTEEAIKLFNGPGSGSGSGSGGEEPFSAMEIDGVEQSEVANEYTFSTAGEHTVKYTLADPTSIGNNAFNQCGTLTSIEIPDSVTSIGNQAFGNCSGFTSIDIPNSVTSIGNNAFDNCTSLTSCTIGSGVTSIEAYAFNYCSSLTSIVSNPTTPPTLLGESVFYGVGENGTLTVPNGSQGYCDWMMSNLPGDWTIEGVTCGGSGSGA